MVAGLIRVGPLQQSPFYADIVKLRIGSTDDTRLNTYVVDGQGIVLYHSAGENVGLDFSPLAAVASALRGDFVDEFAQQGPAQAGFQGSAGAMRTRSRDGQDVVAYYAAIPGTPWSLVSEASWGGLLSLYQGYLLAQSLLFVLGVAIPALVVAFAIRRITEPIFRLMGAAREVARGNLGHALHVHSGDELEDLVEQFNQMSQQLARSYAGIQEREERLRIAHDTLEQRVAARTRDLATLNVISALTSRSLDLNEILSAALDKTLDVLGMDFGAAYRLEGDRENEWLRPEEAATAVWDHLFLHALVFRGLGEPFAQSTGRVPLTAVDAAALFDTDTPQVWDVETARIDTGLRSALEAEGVVQVVSIPLRVQDRLVGALQLGARQRQAFPREELQLMGAIGQQIAVAAENARLYDQAEQTAALAERHRLSRELHDSVTQSLYSVTMYAEAAARVLAAGDTVTTGQHLHELRDTAQEALREMRLLIFELRPLALDKIGLAAALRARLDSVEVRGGMKTELQVEGVAGPGQLAPAVEEELYHIAQEALNNVLKHAHARHVRVQLVFAASETRLSICDDGAGFTPSLAGTRGGLGLPGLRERASKIGGQMAIESTLGQGTKVCVILPTRSTNGAPAPEGDRAAAEGSTRDVQLEVL
jgi:signal transduction histidine kinase